MSMIEYAKKLPERPGVYYLKDARGRVVYVGKAANLKRRVISYFQKAHDSRIGRLVSLIHDIDYQETPSVLEALILEANEIRRFMPKYNVKERDDKSFLYLVFTRDRFPKPLLVRGQELARVGARRFRAVYGPYLSAASIRAALKMLRRIFPYSTDDPPAWSSRGVPTLSGRRGDLIMSFPRTRESTGSPILVGDDTWCQIASSSRLGGTSRNDKRLRPCFYYHLKLCPGVCIGAIDARTYAKTMHHLGMVFAGRKTQLLRELKRLMKHAAKEHRFEEAAKLRNQIFALRHIQDVAVLTREEREFFGPPLREELAVNVFGRIEGYDISMISGVEAVGSMVVFDDGEPERGEYRKFRIKWVKGINDVAMIKEVLRRRLVHFANRKSQIANRKSDDVRLAISDKQIWRQPDLILIDGGWGQVNAAQEVLGLRHLNIPVIGIAKGFKRKQDRPIYNKDNPELARIAEQYKDLLLRVRDEAHRFAVAYHRTRMRRRVRTGA